MAIQWGNFMKKVLIAGCLFLLTACTPKEYSMNVSTGQEQLKKENFAEALTSFEKAQKEKKTEEVEVFIKAAHLLNESTVALNEGRFDSSVQQAEEAQKIKSEDKVKKTIHEKAEQLITESNSLKKQKAEMEDAITKGEQLAAANQFDEAYDVLNKGNQNRLTDNQTIAALSEKLTSLMKETVTAKKTYKEKIAKEEEEKKKKQEAIRLAEEQKKKEEAEAKRAAAAEEEQRKEQEAKRVAVQRNQQKTETRTAVEKQQKTKELTSTEAAQLVKNYLNITNTKLHIEYDHMDGDNYIIHVYEVVIDDPETQIGHTATYGWYGVNKKTKEIYDAFN